MSAFPRRLCLWLVCAAELWTSATGATNHTVLMGVAGSFFDPAVLSAQLGDTVTFVFGSGVHGATQSTFENPCVPLEGGFNSGVVPAINASQPVKSWDLTITNISMPIYYFCQVTRPASHCGAGMVGAINPPSIDIFNQFVSLAKAVNGTPSPIPGITLSGVGAYATGPPSATPGAPTPSPPPSSPPTTPTPTPASTSPIPATVKSSPTSSKAGPIAGGVIGGFVALAIIVILAFLLRRTRRRLQQKQFIDSTSVYKDPTTADRHRSDDQNPLSYTTPQSPGRRYGTLRPLPVPPQSDAYGGSSPSLPHQQMTQADVHALAQEVASLIRIPGELSSLAQSSRPGTAANECAKPEEAPSLPEYTSRLQNIS